jgi:hypothetical protein
MSYTLRLYAWKRDQWKHLADQPTEHLEPHEVLNAILASGVPFAGLDVRPGQRVLIELRGSENDSIQAVTETIAANGIEPA